METYSSILSVNKIDWSNLNRIDLFFMKKIDSSILSMMRIVILINYNEAKIC